MFEFSKKQPTMIFLDESEALFRTDLSVDEAAVLQEALGANNTGGCGLLLMATTNFPSEIRGPLESRLGRVHLGKLEDWKHTGKLFQQNCRASLKTVKKFMGENQGMTQSAAQAACNEKVHAMWMKATQEEALQQSLLALSVRTFERLVSNISLNLNDNNWDVKESAHV